MGRPHSPPTIKWSPVSFEGFGERAGEQQEGLLLCLSLLLTSFPGGSVVKNPPAMQEMLETGVPSLGGGGHGNPLQYSCLENPMDRGAWRATVNRVAKSQTRLRV